MMRNALLLLLLLAMTACHNSKSTDGVAGRFVVTDCLPSRQIRAFAEDCRGYIWIGTYGGLCRYNGQSYNQYFMDDDSLTNRNYSVTCLLSDEEENLWVGAVNGLYRFRYGSGFTKVSNLFVNRICDTGSGCIVFDDMSSVWTVNKVTLEVKQLHSFPTSQSMKRIVTDKFGMCWINEGDKMLCVDIVTGKTEAELDMKGVVQAVMLFDSDIYVATDQGVATINTYNKKVMDRTGISGLETELKGEGIKGLLPYDNSMFFAYTDRPRLYLFSSKGEKIWGSGDPGFAADSQGYDLSAMFIDSKKNIWIGTQHNGFKTFFRSQMAFVDDNALKWMFNGQCITSLSSDINGDMLIVANEKNVFRYTRNGKIESIKRDSKEGIVQVLSSRTGKTYLACSKHLFCGSLSGDVFSATEQWELYPKAIAEDMHGNLYVRSLNGPVFVKALGDDGLKEAGDNLRIVKMMTLHDGRMAMLEATKGVFVSEEIRSGFRLMKVGDDGNCGEDVVYTDFCQDSKGNLWLASYGEGIVRIEIGSGQSTRFLSSEYCNEVSSIVEDNWGNIWMGTNQGLTRFQPSTGKFITFYEDDGVTGNEFVTRAALRTSDNRLAFGSNSGITYFSPEQIPSDRGGKLMMEYLAVNGKQIQDLATDDVVHLSHDNAAVDFSFTTLQYGESASTYQYQMEGFDPSVSFIHGTEHAYYSHLPVGKYTFRVKVLGTDVADSEKTIRVIVHPTVWGTAVMKWFVYPLTAIALFILALLVAYRRNLFHERLRSAEYDKEQERKANEMNMRFFSNISHEFRTPLTLINGALSMIKSGGDERLLGIMRSNTERMLRLVNQLMDFNKMENGMLRLSVSRVDVCGLLKNVMSMFEASLNKRGMECSLVLPDEPVTALVDVDKFEKIMVNLVSNAIKYSGDGCKLAVRLSVSGDLLTVDVADTGIGVPEDKREDIFRRFYQLKQTGQLPAIGTGVGLYYVRSLVELHHGRIRCLANEPQGSVFSFSLPMNTDAYAANELSSGEQCGLPIAGSMRPQKNATVTSDAVTGQLQQGGVDGAQMAVPTIMVVDDDPEVMEFLRLLLEPNYQMLSYSNATAAYKDIESAMPDLILSDVMMYEIDGYKFCRMVKDNSAICHIPVVLLTAKTAMEEQIHGLDCGASAYVTKPFSPDYLLALIKSQLENVRYIQQTLGATTKIKDKEKKLLEEADSKLMKSFYDFFEEHLSDQVLQIDELTKYLGMSRTKVFYKLKALTGDTPSAFFKAYKLNRAAEMILEGNDKIAYISDVTGFSSTSYFSTSFKKQFNCSPSEYKQLHGD